MKKSVLFLSFVFAITINMFAQQNQQPPKMLKPSFIVEDIYFGVQTLNTIELNGQEVDAFLQVRNYMQSILQNIVAANKQPADKITVEMPVPIAQNLITFLQRAKLIGANADKFQRFVNSVVDAAKQFNESQNTK